MSSVGVEDEEEQEGHVKRGNKIPYDTIKRRIDMVEQMRRVITIKKEERERDRKLERKE